MAMYPSVYSYIETYEGLGNTLDCAISELQRGEQDRFLADAIDKLASARAILSQYKGQIDPSLSEERKMAGTYLYCYDPIEAVEPYTKEAYAAAPYFHDLDVIKGPGGFYVALVNTVGTVAILFSDAFPTERAAYQDIQAKAQDGWIP